MAETITHKYTLSSNSQQESYKDGALYNSAYAMRLELRLEITQYPAENKSIINPSVWWVGTGKLSDIFVNTQYDTFFTIYEMYGGYIGENTEIKSNKINRSSYSLAEGETGEQKVLWYPDPVTIYHQIDGTAQLAFRCGSQVRFSGFTYQGKGGIYSSVRGRTITVELPTFNRGDIVLTAANFNDEENPVITYSATTGKSLVPYTINDVETVGKYDREDTINYIQAAISLDGVTADIAYRDIPIAGTSYTFNLTEAEREILRQKTANTASTSIYFLTKVKRTVEDYIGHELEAEQVGAVERTLSIINAAPIISPSVIDTNAATVALTGDDTVLVKYFSNAKAALNVYTKKWATLADYNINNGSNVADATEYTFNAVENNYFYFYVKDSRQNSVHSDITRPMVDYVKLTCNLANNKPDTSGNISVECFGNYFNGSFGVKANTLKAQYRYKLQSGEYSAWVDMVITKSGNTYRAAAALSGLDYQATYVFECRAIDELMTVSTDETPIKSLPVFDWSGTDFNFNVPVKINGIELDYILEQGTKDSWNYRKWKSGILELWGSVSVQPTFNNSYGNGWNTDSINVPLPFEVEDITAITGVSSDMTYLSGVGNSAKYIWFALAAPHSISTSKTYDVFLDIKGTWKQEV